MNKFLCGVDRGCCDLGLTSWLCLGETEVWHEFGGDVPRVTRVRWGIFLSLERPGYFPVGKILHSSTIPFDMQSTFSWQGRTAIFSLQISRCTNWVPRKVTWPGSVKVKAHVLTGGMAGHMALPLSIVVTGPRFSVAQRKRWLNLSN